MIVQPRAVTPGPEFLAEVAVHYALRAGCPTVMLGHAEADVRRRGSIDRYLRGIAAGLGLHAGPTYPRTRHVLYYAWDTWALDYGHPESLLQLPRPSHDWALTAQRARAAHVGVCLDPSMPPSGPDRVLTGTVGYRADRPIGMR
ncbi:hypothetical protein [Streptomyces sp. NPDC090022]|uniref:hypothetical protein n=1 Tax=Streptomyces sp. NPDC090022 TaxID=3365920 RepID=UPI0037F1C22F